jgi:hypothetical protein
MKEYRLAAWPDLRPPYDRMAYRRMVSALSQRHMTVWQLVDASGLRRIEVQNFIEVLQARGVMLERRRRGPSFVGALSPVFGWLRRRWRRVVFGD